MKVITKTLLLALGVALFIAPAQGDAKEQHGHNKSESRKATVHGSSNKSSAHRSHNSHKSSAHKGNSHKRSHQGNNKHYTSKKKHDNSHYRGNNHKKHNKYKHQKRRHYSTQHNGYYHKKKRHGFAKGLILGATLHHALGPHGRYYRGHSWCPSHYLYHTHGYVHSYHYNSHHTYYGPRKVESYIELDEGMCYKVTEYSNGDQKRKRIRDYNCDDLDEWAEWEEWD